MAQNCYHASIEGAQHGAKTHQDFLDYAKRSGASGAQPSNYMLRPDKYLREARAFKRELEKRLMSPDAATNCHSCFGLDRKVVNARKRRPFSGKRLRLRRANRRSFSLTGLPKRRRPRSVSTNPLERQQLQFLHTSSGDGYLRQQVFRRGPRIRCGELHLENSKRYRPKPESSSTDSGSRPRRFQAYDVISKGL